MENKKDLLKVKRMELLKDLINEMQLAIRKNKIEGESTKRIFIYSRIAEYTYYSEVSIRKFLTGSLPKDVASFVENILRYGNSLKMDSNYLNNFAKEYVIACSAILIASPKQLETKNNLMIQDLSSIVRGERLTTFLNEFMKNIVNMCYLYGYKLSGKTKSVLAYVYDLININSEFHNIVWNAITKEMNQLDYVIETIINVIDENIKINEVEHEQKENICIKLLKENKTLIIIDVGDEVLLPDLIRFLKKIEVWAKIIIMSSVPFEKYEEELLFYCKSFSMNEGMKKEEIKQIMELNVDYRKLINYRSDIVDIIYELTGGFPFAALYICKKMVQENRYGQQLDEIIQRYKEFNDEGYDTLNAKIIDESWDEIDDLAREILMICANFSHSVSLNLVAFISNVSITDPKWIQALEECYKRGILNHLILNNPRCSMNSIIRTLILSKIKRKNDIFLKGFYQKIAKYYIEYTKQVKDCYNDLDKMKIIDELDEYNVICEVQEKIFEQEMYQEYIEIGRNLKYYTYVRGYWEIGQKSPIIKRAIAAQKIKDKNAEIEGFCNYITTMAKQKNKEEAAKYLKISTNILESNKEEIKPETIVLFQHAKALYLYKCEDKIEEAYLLWQENKKNYEIYMNEYRSLVNQLWIDKCKIKLKQNLNQIYDQIKEHYEITKQKNFTRGIIDYQLLLSNLNIKRYSIQKDKQYIQEAEQWLQKAEGLLQGKGNLDKRSEARYFRFRSIICAYKKEKTNSKEYYEKACKIYQELDCKEDIKLLTQRLETIDEER